MSARRERRVVQRTLAVYKRFIFTWRSSDTSGVLEDRLTDYCRLVYVETFAWKGKEKRDLVNSENWSCPFDVDLATRRNNSKEPDEIEFVGILFTSCSRLDHCPRRPKTLGDRCTQQASGRRCFYSNHQRMNQDVSFEKNWNATLARISTDHRLRWRRKSDVKKPKQKEKDK